MLLGEGISHELDAADVAVLHIVALLHPPSGAHKNANASFNQLTRPSANPVTAARRVPRAHGREVRDLRAAPPRRPVRGRRGCIQAGSPAVERQDREHGRASAGAPIGEPLRRAGLGLARTARTSELVASAATGDKQVDHNIREANEAYQREKEQKERDQAKQNDRDSRTGVTIDKDGVRK